MKLLLVLLACIAASSAATYSYDYWCARKFYVYPAPTCFHYTITFNNAWCSSKYYAPVLKVYPGDDCGQAGWSETSVATIETEMKKILSRSLYTISSQLYSARNAWLSKLCAVQAAYISSFEKYIKIYYDYQCYYNYAYRITLINQRDERIKAYKAKLFSMKVAALIQYNKAISTKIGMISSYHAKLVKAATDCLNTRLQKIAEYKTKLAAKIKAYVDKFTACNLAAAQKNADYYRKALNTLFASGSYDWYINYKANVVISSYLSGERSKVYALSRSYASHLAGYQARLIGYYTCAYRCYTSSSCLRFGSSYYSQCKSLGKWYAFKNTYTCRYYYLSPFNYNYRFVTYKNLRTCDLNTVVGDIDAVVAQLNSNMNAVVKARTAAFISWKLKWISYHLQYIAKYEKILEDRHNWYIIYLRSKYTCNGYISYTYQLMINKQCAALREQTKKLVAEYKAKLSALIQDCVVKFNARIAAYKSSVAKLISSVKTSFEACKTKRTQNIAAYKAKLEKQRDEARSSLSTKSWEAKVKHWHAFHKLLMQYHSGYYRGGTTYYYTYSWVAYMSNCYASMLRGKCSTLLSQFDAHWRSAISKLVHHYSCGYKCNVSAYSLPTYHCGSYFSWTVRYPTESCYSFYYQQYCQRY